MKGPGVRVDQDVRRIWRCPRCGRIARTQGQTVAQRCGCVDEGSWMQLQPPVKREPYRPPLREPIPEDDVRVDAEPVATVVEATVAALEVSVAIVSPPPVAAAEIQIAAPEPTARPEITAAPETEVFGEGIIPPAEPP